MLDMTPIKERIQCSTPGLWTWDHKGANEIMLPVDDGQPVGTLLMGEDKYGFALNFGYVTDEGDAELITHAREDLVALVAEVERLRDDNHALQAEIILTLEQHERIREAVARHRVQILNGGHPLAEDVTLWAVLDA